VIVGFLGGTGEERKKKKKKNKTPPHKKKKKALSLQGERGKGKKRIKKRALSFRFLIGLRTPSSFS